MVRRGHVVAAFIGVVIAAYLRSRDPVLAQENPTGAVLWTALMFGAVWEIMVRSAKALQGVYRRLAQK
jgi:hypothetical protein